MILADKIIELRKKNGLSQEELAEKLNVSRQSISKWEGAQSIPDMNKILKLSDLFSVSTDYLLKDEIEEMETQVPIEDHDSSAREASVSMEEANAFLAYKSRIATPMAFAVLLFIVSAAPLIALQALQEGGKLPLSEGQASGIGVILLLFIIGIGTALFLKNSMDGERFAYLKKEPLNTAYGVNGMIAERKAKLQSSYTIQTILGVLVCILSATPLFFSMIFFPDQDMAMTIAVPFLLLLVGVGLFLLVRASIPWNALQILSEEGEFSRENKNYAVSNKKIASVYWSVTLLLYFILSYLIGWNLSWVIWPIAGVGYGAVISIMNLIRAKA